MTRKIVFNPAKVRRLRELARMTRADLAVLIGVSTEAVERWEMVAGAQPCGSSLIALADALGVQPKSLFKTQKGSSECSDSTSR